MNTKKIFLPIILFCLFTLVFIPSVTTIQASECGGQTGIVKCGQQASCPCELGDLFAMIGRIYNFIVLMVATPLAIIAFSVGGLILLISAGNPANATKGKEIMKWAAIGLFLVFGSWLIINFVLTSLGMTSGSWATI